MCSALLIESKESRVSPGSGKTTTLTAIRIAAERQGHQIEGFAPTSRAARQLKEAGLEAGTLQAFLARGQMRNEI